MTRSEPSLPRAITLDELIALNDEMAALVRSGVPLEPALAELGADMPGRLGQIAGALADRVSRGEPLVEVLADPSAGFPPVYGAVVTSGLRAGRLPAALEALAGSIRRIAETRRGVASAALYPLLVVLFAWGLLALLAGFTAPRVAGALQALGAPGQGLFGSMASWGRWAGYWGPAVPLALVVLAALWWWSSRRASVVEPRLAGRLFGWLPWVGRTAGWSRTATFLEVLALLVENRVPLDEALPLAARASGDPRMVPAARQLADSVRRGETDLQRAAAGQALPPLITWLMSHAGHHAALLPALRHAADTYHRRARQQADTARVFLPVVLTLVVGGGVVLLYALILFVPYASMLRALGTV